MNKSKVRRQETGDRRQESEVESVQRSAWSVQRRAVGETLRYPDLRTYAPTHLRTSSLVACFLLLASCFWLLSSCGVEEHGGAQQVDFSALQPEPDPDPVPEPDLDIDTPEPDETVTPTAAPALPLAEGDLEPFYRNTIAESGVSVDVSPHALDFGTTREGAPLELPFSVTNQSGGPLSLRMNVASLKGGFRIIGASGESAFLDGESLAAGETKEFKVKFLASRAGTTTALVVIQDPAVTGFIHLPARGTVSGVSGEYRIIPSTHMCSNRNAPEIESLDFLKVASGRSAVKQIKICNKSDRALKIQAVRFEQGTGELVSAALSETRTTTSPFEWFVEETLAGAFQTYYNHEADPVDELEFVPYPGPPVDGPPSFSVRETSTRRFLNGLIVGPDSYVKLDVRFSPSADIEAPEGQIFEPVGISATLVLETEMGSDSIDLVGATSGREPVLEILHASEANPTFQRLEMTSHDAIDFGEVTVFKDWVTETGNDRFLRFSNVGSASKPLKVWLDPLNAGFFIFVREELERRLPLVIPAGQSRTLKVRYYPPVASASGAADLGQLVVRHNGSNGPRENVILTGHARESAAIKVIHGGLSLKIFNPTAPPYPVTAPKRFCLVQIGTGTDIPFTVENHSALPGNNLIAHWSVTDLVGARADRSSGDVSVPPAGSIPFQLHLTPTPIPPNEAVNDGDQITGRLSIRLEYVRQAEFPGAVLPSYDVAFAAPARIDGTCTQLGGPLDGTATIVIDRITMNLKGGGMFEPARNPPSFKFHLPIDLDLETRSARVHGLPFNSSPDVPPIEQIRSYAHQITSVRGLGCTPLPTNPYNLEFEPGSWNGPGAQCGNAALNVFPNADGSATCMANNGGEDFVEGGVTYQVFYHEFVRFNPNDCTISQYGRISTFNRRLLPDEESFEQVFARLQANPNASEDEFAAITRPFQFGSFIVFNQPYDCGGTPRTGRLEGDSEAIEACWRQMTNDGAITRGGGMLEECSYFQFTIEEGCAPGDPGCPAVAGNPDTYTGYGEYEPYDNPQTPVEEEDESKWDITLRNVHIQAFAIVHGAQFEIFGHASHLLFSDLYVTLTTKAIGKDINASEAEAKELIAVRSRGDFERIEDDDTLEGGIFQSASSERTQTYWTDSGVNSQFTVEGGDEEECSSSDPLSRCKGNFMYTTGGQYIMHAGEPVDYTQDHARTLLVGLASFHGKQQTAPSFAREDVASGKGPALYFTFHGCLHPGEGLDPSVGCYEETTDELLDEYRTQDVVPEDEDGLINFRIFPEDRDRYTNYYRPDGDTFFLEDFDYTGLDCGYGM